MNIEEKKYAGILDQLIIDANIPQMQFKDIQVIAEKRAKLFEKEGFQLEKDNSFGPGFMKYILKRKKDPCYYEVTVAKDEDLSHGIVRIEVIKIKDLDVYDIEEAGFTKKIHCMDSYWIPHYYKFNHRF